MCIGNCKLLYSHFNYILYYNCTHIDCHQFTNDCFGITLRIDRCVVESVRASVRVADNSIETTENNFRGTVVRRHRHTRLTTIFVFVRVKLHTCARNNYDHLDDGAKMIFCCRCRSASTSMNTGKQRKCQNSIDSKSSSMEFNSNSVS